MKFQYPKFWEPKSRDQPIIPQLRSWWAHRAVASPALRFPEAWASNALQIAIQPCRRFDDAPNHHRSPAMAMRPAGKDSAALFAPGTVTVPLGLRRNASPFWIILLLVAGRRDLPRSLVRSSVKLVRSASNPNRKLVSGAAAAARIIAWLLVVSRRRGIVFNFPGFGAGDARAASLCRAERAVIARNPNPVSGVAEPFPGSASGVRPRAVLFCQW